MNAWEAIKTLWPWILVIAAVVNMINTVLWLINPSLVGENWGSIAPFYIGVMVLLGNIWLVEAAFKDRKP